MAITYTLAVIFMEMGAREDHPIFSFKKKGDLSISFFTTNN